MNKWLCLKIQTKDPTAWFAPESRTGLDLTEAFHWYTQLGASEEVRTFLEKEGIREIDSVDIVVKSILRKYQNEPIPFVEADYRADLRQIRKAFADNNDDAKGKFIDELKKVTWLACIYASGKEPNKIFWMKPNAQNLYEQPTLPIPHRGIEAYFLHTSVIDELNTIQSTRNYLKSCLTKIDPIEFVQWRILPTYPKNDSPFDESNYRTDLILIHQAYIESYNANNGYWLRQALSKKSWLVCTKLNDNGHVFFKTQDETKLFTDDLKRSWFQGIENDIDVYFLHLTVTSILHDVIDNLVCIKIVQQ